MERILNCAECLRPDGLHWPACRVYMEVCPHCGEIGTTGPCFGVSWRESPACADERLALLDENAHLAAFIDDLRKAARAVVEPFEGSYRVIALPGTGALALRALQEQLDCLDRIESTVGGWGKGERT